MWVLLGEKVKITLLSISQNIQMYGVRSLVASIKKERHDVRLIFLPKPFKERYEEKELNELIPLVKDSDLIGISLMTNFFDNAIYVTRFLKKKLNKKIIWGGIHPTIRPEECLKYADMVCVGEAEETMVKLLKKMKNGRNYYNTRGIWFNKGGEIIKNKLRPLIKDLDKLPFPDYSYENTFILDNGKIKKMDEKLFFKHNGFDYMTMPTRGCPFACTYCCNNTFNKMYHVGIRKRSVDNIIKELEQAKKLPVKYMGFNDDNYFASSLDEIRDFCKKYKEKIGRGLVIMGASPSTLTEEKLSLLVDAGLRVTRLGIETASERTKKLYNRPYSNEHIEKCVRIINKFKSKIKLPAYDIIIDNPWESEDDIIDTLMFLTRLPTPYELNVNTLTLFPETELYFKAKKEGIIKDDLEDIYHKHYVRDYKRTYLNSLFYLIQEYAKNDVRISTKIMYLLSNNRLRASGLSLVLYYILKMGTVPIKIFYLKYLLYEGFNDLKKGDFSRIRSYLSRFK